VHPDRFALKRSADVRVRHEKTAIDQYAYLLVTPPHQRRRQLRPLLLRPLPARRSNLCFSPFVRCAAAAAARACERARHLPTASWVMTSSTRCLWLVSDLRHPILVNKPICRYRSVRHPQSAPRLLRRLVCHETLGTRHFFHVQTCGSPSTTDRLVHLSALEIIQ
jgi:hypothetical protein